VRLQHRRIYVYCLVTGIVEKVTLHWLRPIICSWIELLHRGVIYKTVYMNGSVIVRSIGGGGRRRYDNLASMISETGKVTPLLV